MECSLFKCNRCSDCCFFKGEDEDPILLPHEVYYLRILGKHIGVKLEFKQLENGFYRWIIKGYCPFYDPKSHSCRIHVEKPLACRMFPLLLDIVNLGVVASSKCTWVGRCIGRIKSISSEGELAKIFPVEYEALKELLGVIYSNGVIAVAFRAKASEDVLSKLREKCEITSCIESRLLEGLHLVLLTGCNSEFVEEVVGSDNVEFLIEEKLVLV
jgi:Fe-S-cluster containining protein